MRYEIEIRERNEKGQFVKGSIIRMPLDEFNMKLNILIDAEISKLNFMLRLFVRQFILKLILRIMVESRTWKNNKR